MLVFIGKCVKSINKKVGGDTITAERSVSCVGILEVGICESLISKK